MSIPAPLSSTRASHRPRPQSTRKTAGAVFRSYLLVSPIGHQFANPHAPTRPTHTARTAVSNGGFARTSSRSAAYTGEPRSSTRQLSVDATAQLLRAERLREVVVRTDLKPSIDVGVLTPRSEQDHPDVGSPRIGAQLPQDLESTEFRHHHVENAEIRAFCLRQHETRLAVGRRDHPVAVMFETETDDVEDVLFIVDYEYGFGGGRRDLHSPRLRLCHRRPSRRSFRSLD